MDIGQVKYFILVAETLNFTEAGRRSGMAQSTISHNIAELEKQLGVQLFNRTNRVVTLTDAGRDFLPFAVKMTELSDKALFQVQKREGERQGHISIAADPTASEALRKCALQFRIAQKKLFLGIDFMPERDQIVAMNEEKYDFYFMAADAVPARFKSMLTHTDRLCVAFPSDHPLAREPLDFEKLSKENFISASEADETSLHSIVSRIWINRGCCPNIFCMFDAPPAVMVFVGAGVGISIVPESFGSVYYSKNVLLRPIDGDDAVINYAMAWKKGSKNPAAPIFEAAARRCFGNT